MIRCAGGEEGWSGGGGMRWCLDGTGECGGDIEGQRGIERDRKIKESNRIIKKK